MIASGSLWLLPLLAACAWLLASRRWRGGVAVHTLVLAGLTLVTASGELLAELFDAGTTHPLTAWTSALFLLSLALSDAQDGHRWRSRASRHRSAEDESPKDDPPEPADVAAPSASPPEQSDWLELALTQMCDGIAVFDLDAKLKLTNDAWASMHGFEADEVVGHHLSLFHTPDQMDREVRFRLEEVKKVGICEGEVGHRRKDGSTFPTLTCLTLLCDNAGQSVGFVVVAHEIPRHRAGGEDFRDRVVLEARRILHEENNLLTGILGNAHLVQQDLRPGTSAHEEIEEVVAATRRLGVLNAELRAVLKGERSEPPTEEAPPAVAAAPPPAAEAKPQCRGTVLVVDDHEVVRDVTTSILETFGYKVLSAADGAPGVEIYLRHQGEIRVVLLDLSMPRMDGREALRQIRAIDAGAKVILMTGHQEDEVREATSKSPGDPVTFVQKPFQPEELIAAVREVLGD